MSEEEIINISDTLDESTKLTCDRKKDHGVKYKKVKSNKDEIIKVKSKKDKILNKPILGENTAIINSPTSRTRKRKHMSSFVSSSSSKRAKHSSNLATSTPIRKQGKRMIDKGLSPIVFPITKKDPVEHKCPEDGSECNCKMFENYIKKMEEMKNEMKKLLDEKKSLPRQLSPIREEEEECKEVFHTSVINTSQQFISENINVGGRIKKDTLRPIVIDGSNIAYGHAKGCYFSVRGLKICIDFFLRRGHKVYAFIPSYRLKKNQTDDQTLLMELVRRKLIFCTSSHDLLGGKKICSYDDRILVQVASAMKAVIVSSDNFRDLIREDYRLRPAIENGLLIPTWVEDLIIFPDDPQGRNGPSLRRFLRNPFP